MIFDSIIDLIKRTPFILLYGCVLILAITRYRKYYDTPLKYFPIFILYTFINETLGGIIRLNQNFSLHISDFYLDNNWMIYNIYDIVVHLYLFYAFWSFINNKKYKKFILYGSVLYILVSIINLFFQNFMLQPQTYAYTTAGLVLICVILFYYLNQKSDSRPFFGNRDLLSWIGAGLLIFYSGYLPIIFIRFYNTLLHVDESIYLRKIHLSLIIIMYICFIIGFIKMKRIKTPS